MYSYQIIGIDLHNPNNKLDEDFLVATCLYGACRHIISCRQYKPELKIRNVLV